MRQNGWLDFAYGVWHQVLETDDYPVRYWGDKETALVELTGEGWIVIGPFPRRYRKGWVLDRTYSLVRFVQ